MDKDLVIYNMMRILTKDDFMSEEEAVEFLKDVRKKIEKGEIS